MSKLYEVVFQQLPLAESQFQDRVPLVIPYKKFEEEMEVPQEPVTWREAKKRVRQFYLEQAHTIRAITESSIKNG